MSDSALPLINTLATGRQVLFRHKRDYCLHTVSPLLAMVDSIQVYFFMMLGIPMFTNLGWNTGPRVEEQLLTNSLCVRWARDTMTNGPGITVNFIIVSTLQIENRLSSGTNSLLTNKDLDYLVKF